MKTDKRDPAEGEVWAGPCRFRYLVGKDGVKKTVMRAGHYPLAWDLEGYELRTVIAVVDLPGRYQRRVFYTRKYSPDGGRAFGSSDVKCATIVAFNNWRNGGRDKAQPATLVQESHVETAVKALEAA